MSQDTPGSTATAATPSQQGDALENLLHENRKFAPSEPISPPTQWWAADVYAEAEADRPAFWAKQARELLTWDKDFTQALDWSNPPFAKWFVGGEVNAAYNALDRHVENGLGDRVAIYFEGEPGDSRTYTYAELTEEVKKAANAFEVTRRGQGRSRGCVPADDSRGSHHAPCLRPDRCRALGGVRWFLRGRAPVPHRRRRSQARGHRRRHLPSRQAQRAEDRQWTKPSSKEGHIPLRTSLWSNATARTSTGTKAATTGGRIP
jgi:hypothetical protein